MIKVEHTKIHEVSNKLNIDTNDVLVTDAKLVLVECNRYEALLRKAHGEGQYWILLNSNGWLNDDDKFYKPILISETEKIEVGDWYLDKDGNIKLFQDSLPKYHYYEAKKILDLPEHFSPQQLQMIVDGKLKDGDKVLVECVQEEPIPMTYKGVDSRGDYIYYCPKCGWGGSYMGTGQVHCYKDECRPTTIKLNPHITIYPPVEEKMYTKKEIANYIQQFSEAAMTHGSSFNGRLFLTNWDQWFEQNVK